MDRLWRLGGIVAAAALFLPGCWLFGGEPSGMPEKTFGVYNAFPEHPLYLKKKPPTPNHKGMLIQDLCLKPRLTREVIQFLEARGYRAVAVEDPSVLEGGAVDVLLEVLPLKVYKSRGMTGYGFSDRDMLWGLENPPASSFVALQVSMRRRFSSRKINTRLEARFSQLGGKELPETWDRLSQEEKEAFERNLTENTTKAVYLVLSRLKI